DSEKKIDANKSLSKRVKSLENELGELKKKLNVAVADVDAMKATLERVDDGLDKLSKAYKESMPAVSRDIGKIQQTLAELTKKNGGSTPKEGNDLKARVARIERILEQIERKMNSTSLYPPPEDAGRVLLRNDYDEEVLFVINGRSNRL